MRLLHGSAMSVGSPDGDENEDCYALDLDHGIAVIADGIGGRAGAAQASTAATAAFIAAVLRADGTARRDAGTLCDAVTAANVAVRALAEADYLLTGSGSTLTAFVADNADDTRATIVHVGDGRVYRVRNGTVERLTTDHNIAAELVAHGHLSEVQARRHPLRARLSRAVGVDEALSPDIVDVTLAEDDWLVLVTDGVINALLDARLDAMLRAADDAERLARRILTAVTAAPCHDDATVVVVRVPRRDD